MGHLSAKRSMCTQAHKGVTGTFKCKKVNVHVTSKCKKVKAHAGAHSGDWDI